MQNSGRQFIKSYFLPALFLFAIPSLGYWFAGHDIRTLDERYRALVVSEVRADESLADDARGQVLAYFQQLTFSTVCRSGEPPPLSEAAMQEVCGSYEYPTLAQQVSLISLALGALSVLVVGLCGAVSFLSRPSQYASFVVGWNYLRVASSIQVVLQGAIAVWLSYAMTALWFNQYWPKLILAIAVLAGLGVLAVIVAIFRRVGAPLVVEGQLIEESRSPELWARIRGLCAKLETAPPNRIVAGIDHNFFVTECEVSVEGQLLRGRTLFVSLSLLRTLNRDEADAVLAHEMAHFSGGDTEHSKKLAPGMERFRTYLAGLHASVITRPIYSFMEFYWTIVQLAVKRSSRERELRADAIAKRETSAAAVARALLKVSAYSAYRQRVEGELFGKKAKHTELGIATQVAVGFSSYAESNRLMEDLEEGAFPHPFDSHPPLLGRIAALEADALGANIPKVLQEPCTDSWLSAIEGADEMERLQWTAYEKVFAAAHDRSLAYRYLPATPEEEAHVVQYFPKVEISGPKGGPLVLDHRGLTLAGSGDAIDFWMIQSATVEDLLFKKYLEIRAIPMAGSRRFKVCISDLAYDKDAFLSLFNDYYGRHQVAAGQAKG